MAARRNQRARIVDIATEHCPFSEPFHLGALLGKDAPLPSERHERLIWTRLAARVDRGKNHSVSNMLDENKLEYGNAVLELSRAGKNELRWDVSMYACEWLSQIIG